MNPGQPSRWNPYETESRRLTPGSRRRNSRIAPSMTWGTGASVSKPATTTTRAFAARPRVVFRAWTDPKLLARWFLPTGFANDVCQVDPRADGEFRVHMRGPDGQVYPTRGRYLEVREPEDIVYIDTWDDDRAENPPVRITLGERQLLLPAPLPHRRGYAPRDDQRVHVGGPSPTGPGPGHRRGLGDVLPQPRRPARDAGLKNAARDAQPPAELARHRQREPKADHRRPLRRGVLADGHARLQTARTH